MMGSGLRAYKGCGVLKVWPFTGLGLGKWKSENAPRVLGLWGLGDY